MANVSFDTVKAALSLWRFQVFSGSRGQRRTRQHSAAGLSPPYVAVPIHSPRASRKPFIKPWHSIATP